MYKRYLPWVCLALAALACVRLQPDSTVVITATFQGSTPGIVQSQVPAPIPLPQGTLIVPTPNPTRNLGAASGAGEYVVQPGDSLSGIAAQAGVSLETLLALNNLVDPNIIEVGQVILLPAPPDEFTSALKLLPDSRLVRAPGSSSFDVFAFVASQPGYIRVATDIVKEATYTGAQIVQRVALEYSVDPRLLLALLEFKSQWLTNANPSDQAKTYPMGAPASPLGFDRNGLYRQLTWAADQLNLGYYGWKVRGLQLLEFEDGTRLQFAPDLNAGTVGLQYMLAQFTSYAAWQQQVSASGFLQTYVGLFGDPFAGAIDPLVPGDITQPTLTFPFPSGETWYFTGGPHGGWGSGSAWAAIDFAPPDDITKVSSACYQSAFYATAVASGVVARTDEGTVILDLDGDGDESTGWTILYLHMAAQDRIQAGTAVSVGDRIGHPSCEGGFSTGTHMHIARRYNGEWIPVSCDACADPRPAFNLNGWTVVGYTNQEYQGYMFRGSDRRVADQGRTNTENQVAW
ncbi:LysM peptidoglycan-binding domain-containing protein [Candidatus Flexifilum breve]|uniref:LysM peptidoglycan-binding domain-containing protein n=1 Tax=Candidatus Flexifilum breve TaxID=3140694 RepID=UPI0031CC81A6